MKKLVCFLLLVALLFGLTIAYGNSQGKQKKGGLKEQLDGMKKWTQWFSAAGSISKSDFIENKAIQQAELLTIKVNKGQEVKLDLKESKQSMRNLELVLQQGEQVELKYSPNDKKALPVSKRISAKKKIKLNIQEKGGVLSLKYPSSAKSKFCLLKQAEQDSE